MVVHVVPIHDDAWGAATAGFNQGGTALTAALTYNDDLQIDLDPEGRLPVLRDVIVHEFDVNAADAGSNAQWSLRPNIWPSTRTLSGYATHYSSQIDGPLSVPQSQETVIEGKYNIADLPANMSWISAQSKLYATAANADILMGLVYSYGAEYPYKGGHIQAISQVATGALTADTWVQMWSGSLQSVGYGLDPKKNYVLRGIGGGNDAVDEVDMGYLATKQTGFHQMLGFGSGNDIGNHTTWYMHDGIPCSGVDGWTMLGLLGVNATPWGTLFFEEYD